MGRRLHPLLLGALFALLTIHPPPAAAISFVKAGPRKFQFLNLQSASKLADATADCNQTLAQYNDLYDNSDDMKDVSGAAYAHETCLLSKLDESLKAFFGTAAILLGLTPILLAQLGPTLSEIGLISMERPLLAFMISAGSAAFAQTRIFEYSSSDASVILATPTVTPPSIMRYLLSHHQARMWVSAAEYALAAVATFNMMYTAYILGCATILSFEVHVSWLPVLWTAIASIIYMPLDVSFRIRRMRAARAEAKNKALMPRTNSGQSEGQGVLSRIWSEVSFSENKDGKHHPLRSEFRLSLNHKPIDPEHLGATAPGIALYYVANMIAFIHLSLGVLIFSSILFCAVLDAAVIILRMVASVSVCRMILMFELAGLKWSSEHFAEIRSMESAKRQEQTRQTIVAREVCNQRQASRASRRAHHESDEEEERERREEDRENRETDDRPAGMTRAGTDGQRRLTESPTGLAAENEDGTPLARRPSRNPQADQRPTSPSQGPRSASEIMQKQRMPSWNKNLASTTSRSSGFRYVDRPVTRLDILDDGKAREKREERPAEKPRKSSWRNDIDRHDEANPLAS